MREEPATPADAVMRRDLFLEDVSPGVITAVPVTERLLRRVDAVRRSLPRSCYLGTFDALHLVTAWDAGFTEIIWTNDPAHAAAAPWFGLAGGSV